MKLCAALVVTVIIPVDWVYVAAETLNGTCCAVDTSLTTSLESQENFRFLMETDIPTLKSWLVAVVIVVRPVTLSYVAFVTLTLSTPMSIGNTFEPADVNSVTVPMKFVGPIPSATRPNLPKEELEFVRSH